MSEPDAAAAGLGLPEPVIGWCAAALGSTPRRVLFRQGNLSLVVGLGLHDGREVVLKVRPAAARHAGCLAVQRHLADAGLPCPRPLAGPDRVGDDEVSAEAFVPGGTMLQRAEAERVPQRMAAELARLVRLAPPASAVPALDPPPPWAAWDHGGAGLWPKPASGPSDLNAVPGSAWLDDVGARVAARLSDDDCELVVGHVDFESQNVRWGPGGVLHCVHDWDSLAVRSEAAIAGLAAAVFPTASRAPDMASLEASRAFLVAYADCRGRPWSAGERQVAWAAGLWVLAYNARLEQAEGRSGLPTRLAAEADARLALAGA